MIVSARQTLYALKDGAYVCIKGVDFEKRPSTSSGTPIIKIEVAEGHKGGSVEFRAGNLANGEVLAKVEVGEEATATAPFTAPAEKVTDLYIVINGDVELVNWKVEWIIQ